MNHRCLLAAIAIVCVQYAAAQTTTLPFSLWAFPGVSWQQNDRLRSTAQYGYNPQWRMHAAYVQGFLKLNQHLALYAAYLYLQRGKPALEEHTFMPGIILTLPLGPFTLDDRNLYWYRIRRNNDDFHFYRNRLRLAYHYTIGAATIKPYLYAEVFYLFNRSRLTRNRIAPGFSLDIAKRFNLDISFNRELDYYNGRSNLVFVMSTVELHRCIKKGR